MPITYDDLYQFVRILDADKYENVDFESNDLKITVERDLASAVPADPAVPPPMGESPEVTQRDSGFQRVNASSVGRIRWNNGNRPSPGTKVEPQTVLAYIDTLDECTPVTAGVAGEVSMVREFEDSDFVAYGQWLLTIKYR